MPTASLTDRKIDSLKSGIETVEGWDKKIPGFGVRVSPEGTESQRRGDQSCLEKTGDKFHAAETGSSINTLDWPEAGGGSRLAMGRTQPGRFTVAASRQPGKDWFGEYYTVE